LKEARAEIKAFWVAVSKLVSQVGSYLNPLDTDPYHTMMPR
jgi:hypothetical protein